MKARIAEIFESIQGEGIYTGVPQVFVRFFGCDVGCSYCDTPLQHFEEYDVERLLQEISRYKNYHSLCLTGGEPLLQVDFLKVFLPPVRLKGNKIYLETNGIRAEALAQVIDQVDIVAMDFKLPSSTGRAAFWREHEAFLRAAIRRDVYIKMVVTEATRPEDIQAAGRIIKEVKPGVPVVLQPSWPQDMTSLSEKLMFFKRNLAMAGARDVRILPQAHKLVGIK